VRLARPLCPHHTCPCLSPTPHPTSPQGQIQPGGAGQGGQDGRAAIHLIYEWWGRGALRRWAYFCYRSSVSVLSTPTRREDI